MSDEVVSLIFDSGSGLLKAGFSGDDNPRLVFPTLSGRSADPQVSFVGNEALERRSILTLTRPIQRGVVTNFDAMEAVWNEAFNELHATPDNQPILLTEPSLSPKQNREKTAEIMFEKFKVPAMYVSIQNVLSTYATGRTTGIVLDVGEGVSQILPIYEGYAIPQADRLDLAGSDLNAHIVTTMRDSGVTDSETARQIKEELCYVALNPEIEPIEKKTFELPDGQKISIGDNRFRFAEPLFKPSLLGVEAAGIHEMTHRTIVNCEADVQKDLFNNVIVCGGTSMFPGFAERIKKEITARAPAGMKIKVIAQSGREHSVWIGGSIVASLSTFQSLWVSKGEFEEVGSSIVHKKCS